MEVQQASLRMLRGMTRLGAILGASLGALYPLVAVTVTQLLILLSGGDAGAANISMLGIWVLMGTIAGFVIGGIAGIVLGFLTGVAQALVTRWAFTPIEDFHSYRLTIDLASIVAGATGALLLLLASDLPHYFGRGWGREWSWLVWGVLPVVIATAATWWAAHRVTNRLGATTSKAG